jgi:lipoyl(octanoyl) transferase
VERVTQRSAPYVQTWNWQRQRSTGVGEGTAPEALLLVEHEPVYTLGTRSDSAHLLSDESSLRSLGADVVWSDRGGDVTWHGPGQVTGYPILDLSARGRDLHKYVAALEQLLIEVCAAFGVTAHRAAGMPGVWVARAKVAAIGVRITRRWVTYHGFALNVCNEASWFERIVPCGLHGYEVTSLSRLVGRTVAWDEAAEHVERHFQRHFGRTTAVQSPGAGSPEGGRSADYVGRL